MQGRPRNFYDEHAKTCPPDDHWGQVKRTINGRALPREQIELIVSAIRTNLDLRDDDRLLDLCCGNGALTRLVKPWCKTVLGVDSSPYLIGVAKRDFEDPPAQRYVLADAMEFVATTPESDAFTVVLCYGSFMFLDGTVLAELRRRFPNVRRVFLGNLPDKAFMHVFFAKGGYVEGAENDLGSSTGIWRHREEIREIAEAAGWQTEFKQMPESFYAAHYRFDAILTPC